MTEYTAQITARGADSAVPDRPDAVDALILADGQPVGEVTLVQDRHSGELVPWGTGLDHWASSALVDHLDAIDPDAMSSEPLRAAVSDIIDAVREAAEEPAHE